MSDDSHRPGVLYLATDVEAFDHHKSAQRRVMLAKDLSNGSTPDASRVVVCGTGTADAHELALSRFPDSVAVIREDHLKPFRVQPLAEIDPQPTRWGWEGVVPLSV